MDRQYLKEAHKKQIAHILANDNVDLLADDWNTASYQKNNLFCSSSVLKLHDRQVCVSQAKAEYTKLSPKSQQIVDSLGIMQDSRIPTWNSSADIKEMPTEETLEAFSEYQFKLAEMDDRCLPKEEFDYSI